MRFNVFQVSRKGGREKNEDRMGYCYTRDAGLFCVADGMGGHPEGEVASQMALQTLAALFQREAKPRLQDAQRYLTDGVLIAHQQLLHYAKSKKLSDTPRTTVVACVMQGDHCYWAHCGDSRLYLVRQGKLIARTRDHSYIELQEALQRHGSGGVSGAERFNRNVLFTCLGSPGKPMVDCQGPLRLEKGDRMLLCSDGLWGPLSDEEIVGRLAAAELPLAESVLDLVEQALRKGGARCDNVTVVAVEWEGEGEPSRDSSQELDESGFASTIQGGEPLEALDEVEIEREVREINEAIHRTRK